MFSARRAVGTVTKRLTTRAYRWSYAGDVPQNSVKSPASVYKGNGYWVLQISGSLLLAIVLAVLGWFLLLAPDEVLSSSGEPAERGPGVMVLLASLLFLVTFVWLVRRWRRSSKEQRAVYAWAVMQQHATRTDMHPVNPAAVVNDVKILGVAAEASKGTLTAEQISELQALRPDVPYPGKMPNQE